jgi:hypothetical protein
MTVWNKFYSTLHFDSSGIIRHYYRLEGIEEGGNRAGAILNAEIEIGLRRVLKMLQVSTFP